MLPGIELAACAELAVPAEVMTHVARVESSFNPYAIGVVGGRLVRQPKNMEEALSTARMLEDKGYNFSLGISQVNRYNLSKYGLDSYEKAFQVCPNVKAGSQILAECYGRASSNWGKAFSCYYSGNFVTGYKHGYVQKIFASVSGAEGRTASIPLASGSNVSARTALPSAGRIAAAATDVVLATTLAARRGAADPRLNLNAEHALGAVAGEATQAGMAATALSPFGPQAMQPQQEMATRRGADLAPVMLGGPQSFTPDQQEPVRRSVQTQLPAGNSGRADSALVF